MAKPIPKKKAAAKKKRREEIGENFSPKAQKKAERQISAKLMELDELAESRMEWVNMLRESSGEDIDAVLEIMVDNLSRMQGPPKLVLDKHVINLSESEFHLLQSIQHRNFHWIAMRCLVACAEWGLRIGTFKAPKSNCIRCGDSVKPKKKGKS